MKDFLLSGWAKFFVAGGAVAVFFVLIDFFFGSGLYTMIGGWLETAHEWLTGLFSSGTGGEVTGG